MTAKKNERAEQRQQAPGQKKVRKKTKSRSRAKTGKRPPKVESNRLDGILRELKKLYPEPECALHHDNPLQLLVATILSAQCTDGRVNLVTKDLFAKYRTARDFAGSPPGELEQDIRSTGFFNSKAKNIRAACERIQREHDGLVPDTMEELLKLPGVARKTANVVLGTAFGIAAGVVVDTHVSRISKLLKLTRQNDAVKIEQDLMSLLPEHEWIAFSHRIILHGRAVCIARRPRCEICSLESCCPSAFAAQNTKCKTATAKVKKTQKKKTRSTKKRNRAAARR